MKKKLTIPDILDLADRYGLSVRVRYPAQTVDGREAPKPNGLYVIFNSVQPEAWQELVTHATEVPVDIFGTRQSHVSGAIDNRLYPEYVALLPQVNQIRSQLNLSTVYE